MGVKLARVLAVACLAAAAMSARAGTAVTVQSAQGALQGQLAADGSAVFLGVPYALPPLGPLRWRAPQ
ncbi:MAG TPA: carboxylesterase family protein, partial [Steroidobacteraceae bacterium]